MSRYNSYHEHSEKTLAVAAKWHDRCLLGSMSVFSEQHLWTSVTLKEVDERFNGNPDESDNSFSAKLTRQFDGASALACQLLAEMLWVMNLFPSNIGASTKRTAVQEAWSFSGTTLADDHPMLQASLLSGLGSTGAGYNAHRWRELAFFIRAMQDFVARSADDRSTILGDPWAFGKWIDEYPDSGTRQLKYILPFLLFPDTFERISSPRDGRRILIGYNVYDDTNIKTTTKLERDAALLDLRRKLETQVGHPIDFYDADLKKVWAPTENVLIDEIKVGPVPLAILQSQPPLNLILHGPPGTGKTYLTIERTLAVLDPIFAAAHGEDRDALKRRFDELVEQGRVCFTTFHQSFSYEDFVEGLRAEAQPDGSIHYRVTDGVMKAFCTKPILVADTPIGESYFVLRSTGELLWVRRTKGSDIPLPWSIINALADLVRAGTITIADIRNKVIYEKSPESRLEKYIVNGYGNILAAILEKLMSNTLSSSLAPKVLIIDEINRGNVTRIFGELITLLEPSKRAGNDEALSVILPYSKEHFSVPANLHVIGTMNTADRSLSSLDIALRRRFVFEEIEPDPRLLESIQVAGVDLSLLLATLNHRIEVLLDRDHRLGHAYFIGLEGGENLRPLRLVFETQVLPLLQEYFFDDWNRIRLILNDHRKPEPLDRFVVEQTEQITDLFGEGDVSLPVRKRWMLNKAALDRPSAYRLILN